MQIYFFFLVVVMGFLSMGFQLLASRLLSPSFGSSIIVWSWLISTFLAAFTIGSLLGGWISSLPSVARFRVLLWVAFIGLSSLAVTVFAGRALLAKIEVIPADTNVGLALACFGLFFPAVVALAAFGPLNVQFLSKAGYSPGMASGLNYGVSTAGNILGVMGCAFLLIPNFRVSTLLIAWLVAAVISLSALIRLLGTQTN